MARELDRARRRARIGCRTRRRRDTRAACGGAVRRGAAALRHAATGGAHRLARGRGRRDSRAQLGRAASPARASVDARRACERNSGVAFGVDGAVRALPWSSPMAYLADWRLELGAEALRTSSRSVSRSRPRSATSRKRRSIARSNAASASRRHSIGARCGSSVGENRGRVLISATAVSLFATRVEISTRPRFLGEPELRQRCDSIAATRVRNDGQLEHSHRRQLHAIVFRLGGCAVGAEVPLLPHDFPERFPTIR